MKELIEQIAKALVAQSDLGKVKARANSELDPNHHQCSGNEAEKKVHARDSGVALQSQ